MDKVTALKNHLEFKRVSVHSNAKIKDIERYLEKFINYSKKTLGSLNENDLAKFFNSLDYSIRTTNDIKSYVKAFIKWYYKDWSSKFKNLDKLCKLQTPQRAYEPEQMLSFKEVEKLIGGEMDIMWKVYWLVMFYGGFRPSEACSLKWKNIYFEPKGTIIKLHTTKTNKDFYKAVPRNVEHLLKEWKRFNSSEWLFPSAINKGDCIKARSVCARLKRISKKILGKEVVPYQLRHSIATLLYSDDKMKDDVIAEQMGHGKSMRKVYMNLSPDKIKERARRLWIKPKKLSTEKKEEYEKRIKKLEEGMKKHINETSSAILDFLGNEKGKKAKDIRERMMKVRGDI